MKLNIFYSWQSDLPNKKNRGLISSCIDNAVKNAFKENQNISDYLVESDSRNETGTPDLVASIFAKIDICDIFICDISVINASNEKHSESDQTRKTPNPNVLIELGYAAKSIGWTRIICIVNCEYAQIEDLPFDIRSRKPIIYNTTYDLAQQKKQLTKQLEHEILDIFNSSISDKQQYIQTKNQVDLGMQAILIDFCKMLYADKNGADRYNYALLLNSSNEEIFNILKKESFLGFDLYKNIILNIQEFSDFFKDDIEIFFLSDKEKKLVVKMVYALRYYESLLNIRNLQEHESSRDEYKIISGFEMNPSNPKNSYILLKKINGNEGIVINSGSFEKIDPNILLTQYTIPEPYIGMFSSAIFNIVCIVNDWIKTTGNYFIINHRLLSDK